MTHRDPCAVIHVWSVGVIGTVHYIEVCENGYSCVNDRLFKINDSGDEDDTDDHDERRRNEDGRGTTVVALIELEIQSTIAFDKIAQRQEIKHDGNGQCHQTQDMNGMEHESLFLRTLRPYAYTQPHSLPYSSRDEIPKIAAAMLPIVMDMCCQ